MVAEHYIVSDTAEKCRVFHWLPTVPYKCNSLTVLYCLLYNKNQYIHRAHSDTRPLPAAAWWYLTCVDERVATDQS